jgi:hypothetical protein
VPFSASCEVYYTMNNQNRARRSKTGPMKKLRIRLAYAFTSMTRRQIAQMNGVNTSTISRCVPRARVPRVPGVLDELDRIEEYWLSEIPKNWGLDRIDFMLLVSAYLALLRLQRLMTAEEDEAATKVFNATAAMARRGSASTGHAVTAVASS